MAEFKYVTLPTDGKQIRSGQVDEYASVELNEKYVSQGWEPVAVSRLASRPDRVPTPPRVTPGRPA
jgi:hypothetical protein